MSRWIRKVIWGIYGGIQRDKTVDKDGKELRIVSFRLLSASDGSEILPCVAFDDMAHKLSGLGLQHGQKVTIEAVRKPGSDEVTVKEIVTNEKEASKGSKIQETREQREQYVKSQLRKGLQLIAIKTDRGTVREWKPVEECVLIRGEWHWMIEVVTDYIGARTLAAELQQFLGKGKRHLLLNRLSELAKEAVLALNGAPSIEDYGRKQFIAA